MTPCAVSLAIVQAVLAAVNHQLPAADLLLREMDQHQAPSGSDSDEDSANHILPNLQNQDTHDLQHHLASPAAQSSPQTAKAPAPPTNGSSARDSARVMGDNTAQGRIERGEDDGRDKIVQGSTEGGPDDDCVNEDLYYKHRRKALKLSKTWHKKLHQAANAFAASHHSGTALPAV